ncbi:hypothetical protein [Pontibacter sp. SGAir0037]|uniref:hypothetical protein n=1 Tax=Pontibacter sp. SGAir0037 TaxID=2571030 RepID=UPI0010F6351E|nr:hypothetical protein [Pontibacter sp. SGAir0037]
MDSGTIIIGTLCLALIIVPVFYMQLAQKKKARKLLNDLLLQAEKQQLRITEYDFWSPSYAIGLDKEKKQLLYTHKSENQDQVIFVDLREVRQCSVEKISRDSGDSKIIESVKLVFSPVSPKQPDKALPFYSLEESMIFGEELKLAEKWKAVISSLL